MTHQTNEIELPPSLTDIVEAVMDEFPRADVRVEFDRPFYCGEGVTPVLTVVTDLNDVDEYKEVSNKLSSLVRGMEADDEMVYTQVKPHNSK